MYLKNALQEDKDTNIERNAVIYITDRTVRFGNDVYQFRNVAGFGLAEVKNNNIIPTKVIIGGFVLGFLLGIIGQGIWGLLILLLAIGAIVINYKNPKRYGLKLYVNSGGGTIFVTTDLEGVKRVVAKLYDFMENSLDGTFVVNVDDRSISVQGSVGGSVMAGDVGGNVSSHVGRDVY